MRIKKLHIKNFKSLVDLEIVEPNPFTVFVGANGVGKSNIFEALEFYLLSMPVELKLRLFGGEEQIRNKSVGREYSFLLDADLFQREHTWRVDGSAVDTVDGMNISDSFSRVFIGKEQYQKINFSDSENLSLSASNLERVLKRLLDDDNKRDEILEYLQLLIPSLEKVEVQSSDLSAVDTLVIFEKGVNRPFPKELISDGTYNILCLITAVLQSDEPQFLCIEEPENGLTPYVIETLVEMFRSKCEEKGHFIWLNTHSQTLVRLLEEKELILVDKVDGATKIKQLKEGDFYGLSADEAWLTNALGAGLPW